MSYLFYFNAINIEYCKTVPYKQKKKQKYISVFNNKPNIILQIRFDSCILYTQEHSSVLRASEGVQWLLTYPPESLLIH